MKRMHEYELVRRMFFKEGISKREISRRTGYHRKTINKMIIYSSPPGKLLRGHVKSILNPYKPIIDEIIISDKSVPRKQRHTSKRIFDRICSEHGYGGGYTLVKDYIRDKNIRIKEIYFPLEQRPGTAQNDFGESKVIIGGKLQTVHIFHKSLVYSDVHFVKGYPTQNLEAVQDAHISAYSFFGGVPQIEIYDNMSTVVKKVLRGKDRECTDGFIALRSHYLFKSLFCNVRRGNEKGVVEGGVKYVRRNFMVPIPSFNDWDSFNKYLLECCIKRLSMKAAGKVKTIGELFEEDRKVFGKLPDTDFEACRVESHNVSSQSLLTFKKNQYSVPIKYAYREVILKAFVYKLKICYKDEIIAKHQRCYEKGEYILDPMHYVPLLERKPSGLDSAKPFTNWELPECFAILRAGLEKRHAQAGKREYILILQLLRDYSISEVASAIKKAFTHRAVNFESIKMLVLIGREPKFNCIPLSDEKISGLPKVHVEERHASQYIRLMAEISYE